MNKKDQEKINNFTRQYLTPTTKVNWGHIIPERKNGPRHNKVMTEVCLMLLEMNQPFATEVKFKTGYTPDIICPLHIKPIIEVRDSETDKRTLEKFERIPEELHKKIIYIDANKTLEVNDLL